MVGYKICFGNIHFERDYHTVYDMCDNMSYEETDHLLKSNHTIR